MKLYFQLKTLAQGLLGSPDDLGIPDKQAGGSALSDILSVVYLVAGAGAVVVLIISAIFYATSSGDAAKITRAKHMTIYAVVGLIVVMAAFAITNLIVTSMGS